MCACARNPHFLIVIRFVRITNACVSLTRKHFYVHILFSFLLSIYIITYLRVCVMQGATQIADMLNINATLTAIELANNSWTNAGLAQIEAAVARNGRVRALFG